MKYALRITLPNGASLDRPLPPEQGPAVAALFRRAEHDPVLRVQYESALRSTMEAQFRQAVIEGRLAEVPDLSSLPRVEVIEIADAD